METVSRGFLSASSPTFCTDWAWTWPWIWAMSIIFDVWLGFCRFGRVDAFLGEGRRCRRQALAGFAAGRQCGQGAFVRRNDTTHQRAHHEQQHDETEHPHHQRLDQAHDVVFAEMQHGQPAGRFDDRISRSFGKAQIDDLDLVAALLVEADRGAHQRRDLFEVLFAARLVGDVALVVLGIGTVDQDGDREPLEPAALDYFRFCRLGDLVIDDLLGFTGLVARAGVGGCGGPGLIGARQLVADRDLVVALARRRALLPGLARTHHAAVRIILIRGLGNAVEIEIGGDLHARMARSDYRGDDPLHLFAQMLFVGRLALVGGDAAGGHVVAGAIR